jgi:ribosomal protein S18 acetylase RimI-like enzyme
VGLLILNVITRSDCERGRVSVGGGSQICSFFNAAAFAWKPTTSTTSLCARSRRQLFEELAGQQFLHFPFTDKRRPPLTRLNLLFVRDLPESDKQLLLGLSELSIGVDSAPTIRRIRLNSESDSGGIYAEDADPNSQVSVVESLEKDTLVSRSASVIDHNGFLVEAIDLDQSAQYGLCIVSDEQDLPDLSRFIVGAFGADAIRLSTDLNAFERLLMKPAAELLNSYSGVVAFAEVLAGLRSRLKLRLSNDGNDGNVAPLATPQAILSSPSFLLLGKDMSREDRLAVASQTSIVLALARKTLDAEESWHIDVIASVELRLQPCDGKIPFSIPYLDKLERQLASFWFGNGRSNEDNDNSQTRSDYQRNVAAAKRRDLQPYLSNLCVDHRYRNRGIGRFLVQCIEAITFHKWNYSRIYLHVDLENEAALQLYRGQGYKDVGRRWNPFWAGKAATIGYFVKKQRKSK